MPLVKLIHNQDSEIVLEFKGWLFSFPNSPDYEFLANEEKLTIQYKEKQIAEFTFFVDRVHVKSAKCLLSIGDRNITLKCESDRQHLCFI